MSMGARTGNQTPIWEGAQRTAAQYGKCPIAGRPANPKQNNKRAKMGTIALLAREVLGVLGDPDRDIRDVLATQAESLSHAGR